MRGVGCAGDDPQLPALPQADRERPGDLLPALLPAVARRHPRALSRGSPCGGPGATHRPLEDRTAQPRAAEARQSWPAHAPGARGQAGGTVPGLRAPHHDQGPVVQVVPLAGEPEGLTGDQAIRSSGNPAIRSSGDQVIRHYPKPDSPNARPPSHLSASGRSPFAGARPRVRRAEFPEDFARGRLDRRLRTGNANDLPR